MVLGIESANGDSTKLKQGTKRKSRSHHVESLVNVLLRELSRRTVYACLLPIVCRGFTDSLDSDLKVRMELGSDHRPANVISKIPWPDQEDIDSRYSGNLFDLPIT